MFLNLFSMYYISYYSNKLYTAGFGLAFGVYQFFWSILIVSNCETISINCGKYLGALDIPSMKLHFYRGVMWQNFFTICTVIIYYYIDVLLILVGFEKDLSIITGSIACSIIPALFVQGLTESLRAYLICQKVTSPFLYINLVNFVLYLVGGYVFI